MHKTVLYSSGGHSYGGAVISEAGSNPKVVGLVYVAAFAPDVGETISGLVANYPTPEAFSELHPIEDGFLLLTPKGVSTYFAPDLPASETSIMAATQGATQGALLETPIKTAAWHDKPSWYIVAANDKTISPEEEKFHAERMKAKTLIVQSSHVPMLSVPKEVADFIIEAVVLLGESK